MEHTMGKARIQFETDSERVEEMENMMEVCGIATRRDLFNNTLTLWEWAVQEIRAGRHVASVDKIEKEIEYLRMPALEAARKKKSNKKLE